MKKKKKNWELHWEKEKIYDNLVKLVRTFDKKEKYQYQGHDDLEYYGIKGKEDLFDNVNVDDDNYYKPILINSSLKSNYKI